MDEIRKLKRDTSEEFYVHLIYENSNHLNDILERIFVIEIYPIDNEIEYKSISLKRNLKIIR